MGRQGTALERYDDAMRRWCAGAAMILAGCSLVVDTSGLSGGADDEAHDAGGDEAAPSPPPPVAPPPSDAGVDAEAGRVTNGLIALYMFQETSGSTVHDVSGVSSPLDLTIQPGDGGVATFGAAGLSITKPLIVASQSAATKVINACKASHEVTLEMWVTPANVTQDFCRIVGVSGVNSDHDVALDQSTTEYWSLMRSSTGHLDLHAPGTATASRKHVAVTRAKDGTRIIYVDAVEAARDVQTDTDPTIWNDAFGVTCGNATTLDAPWLGTYHLVAIYARALSAAEIDQNHRISPR